MTQFLRTGQPHAVSVAIRLFARLAFLDGFDDRVIGHACRIHESFTAALLAISEIAITTDDLKGV